MSASAARPGNTSGVRADLGIRLPDPLPCLIVGRFCVEVFTQRPTSTHNSAWHCAKVLLWANGVNAGFALALAQNEHLAVRCFRSERLRRSCCSSTLARNLNASAQKRRSTLRALRGLSFYRCACLVVVMVVAKARGQIIATHGVDRLPRFFLVLRDQPLADGRPGLEIAAAVEVGGVVRAA